MKHINRSKAGPFEASAVQRLSRMGLVDSCGALNEPVMEAFIQIHVGLFFSSLCDYYKPDQIENIFTLFQTMAEREDYLRMLLLLSIQYDHMRRLLPDPIWWISGHSEIVQTFMAGFYRKLEQMMRQNGLLSTNSGEEAVM